MNTLIIGIAGGTGSGKTTVTQNVVRRFAPDDVVVIEHDMYYRDLLTFPCPDPTKVNYDHPDALETPLLIRHLGELRDGKPVEQPVYDFSTHRRKPETRCVEPKRIVIVEGILIFADAALRSLMNIRVFVDTDADERLLRRLRRDMVERGRSFESILAQYTSTVKPMHLEFVEPSKRWADIILPRGGENEAAVELIVARIRSML